MKTTNRLAAGFTALAALMMTAPMTHAQGDCPGSWEERNVYIKFAQSSYIVSEGDEVTLTVNKTGYGPATVKWRTDEEPWHQWSELNGGPLGGKGGATKSEDFRDRESVLNFGKGPGSQNITIPTIPDQTPEGLESFYVNLSVDLIHITLVRNEDGTIGLSEDSDTHMTREEQCDEPQPRFRNRRDAYARVIIRG